MYLYIIQSGERGPYKIGITNDLVRRQDELQVGNPEVLYLVASFDFGSESRAQHAERELHKLFKDHRIRGEWFNTFICLKDADKDMRSDLRWQAKQFYTDRRAGKGVSNV